jgi:hypothetical protein
MHFRLMKRYILKYRDTEGQLIPGYRISMSSYAGNIFSLDDLYSVSSGLVVTETTLFVFNTTLFSSLNPTNQVFEGVRVMVSNRLARSGSDWVNIFKKFNSGTYNNQWMVVDYNKIGSNSDILHVLEQLPGKIVHADLTSTLQDTGYWGSYNRAYFEDIFRISGGQEKYERFGDWFSHKNTPRAEIFRATHATVTDKQTMYYLMRFNNYATSPVGQPAGCNGSIPAAAIAARSDLQDSKVGCIWSEFDDMEGRRNYGALDVKIIDRSDILSGSMLAEAGPTHVNNIQPFSWSAQDKPANSPVTSYNFSPVNVVWIENNSTREDRPNPGAEPGSGAEPGANISHFVLTLFCILCLKM